MRKQTRILIAILALTGLVLGAGESAWARKKPLNSYFSGVKIIMKGDYRRPDTALMLLDSAIYYHGHVPEAYKWMTIIHSGMVEEISPKDMDARRERLGKMLESIAKLESSCEDEDVKKKLRKKCKKYLEEARAEEKAWYSQYVNDAQSEYLEIEEGLLEDLKDAEDDQERKEIQAEIDKIVAITIELYKMADFVRPNDLRVNVRLGRILFDQEKYEDGLPYLQNALEISRTSDPDNVGNMLFDVAYAYYSIKDFANAAAVFKERAELLPDETKASGIRNVIASYQGLQDDDSVFKYTNEILKIDPDDGDALALIGGTWFNKAQVVNSSISAARAANDAGKIKALEAERNQYYDSVAFFLDRAVKVDTTDAGSYERLAITYALQGVPKKATFAWKRLTELSPQEPQYWVNLGDNYISIKEFKNSIVPYEKAVELDNTNSAVWRILVDLYETNKMPKKAKKAKARLDELSSK